MSPQGLGVKEPTRSSVQVNS